MATFVNNLGLTKGSHLMEGSTLMPKWEDRSGIPITQSKVNLLPKNVAQDPTLAKGPLFEVMGSSPGTYNLAPIVYQKVCDSEYFKCLFVFKTFEKVVDVIYEKVGYVEPWARGNTKTPSSAYCLLVKLFTLRLTEVQVKKLLDHGDSTYIRALGALYVRYGLPSLQAWRWLSEYADDLEAFAPGLDPNETMTFGGYVIKLMTQLQYYGTVLPKMSVQEERLIKVQLVLLEEQLERGRKNARWIGTDKLTAGALVKAIYDDPDPELARWHTARILSTVPPYEDAPEGTLPEFLVQFPDKDNERVQVKLGMIDVFKDDDDGGERRRHRRRRREDDSATAIDDAEDARADKRRRHRGEDQDERRRRDDDVAIALGDDDDAKADRRRRHRDEDRDERRRRHRRRREDDEARGGRRRRRDNEHDESFCAAGLPPEGEPVLRGRDILADVVRRERESAVAVCKSNVIRKPIGYNMALITSDRESYRKRSRSRSPVRTTVAPLVPSRDGATDAVY